jgi:hypothetical protein
MPVALLPANYRAPRPNLRAMELVEMPMSPLGGALAALNRAIAFHVRLVDPRVVGDGVRAQLRLELVLCPNSWRTL